MLRKIVSIVTIFVLASPFVMVHAGGEGQEKNLLLAKDWWNPSWRFKQSLVVTNNLNTTQIGIPIFTYLAIDKGSMLSAADELRVFSGRSEIPSYILYENFEEGYVVGVYLVFIVNLFPNERRILEIYYGNPDAGMPEYRADVATIKATESATGLSFDSANQQFLIRFGEQYPHSYSLMMRDATGSFSSLNLKADRFEAVSDWGGIGNLSRYSLGAGRVVLKGGSLVIVMTGIWNQKTMWLSSLLVNTGSTGTGLTSLTSLFDFSNLDKLGVVDGHYDTKSDSLQLGVAGTWFGLASSIPPRSFDILRVSEAYEVARSGKFGGRTDSQSDVSFLSRTNIGFLSAGEHAEQLWVWSVSGSREGATALAVRARDGISISAISLEVPDTPRPRATVLYHTSMRLNATFPPSGLRMGLGAPLSRVLTSWAGLSGEVSYSVPNAFDSGFERKGDFWKESSYQKSGLAYSSSNHLVAEHGHVGRLSAVVTGEKGVANASLVSRQIKLGGVKNMNMSLSYIASYSEGANASAFLALNMDYNGDGLADRRMTFLVGGLNKSLPLRFTASSVGYLVANNTWNNVHMDLLDGIPASGARIWFEAKADVAKGSVELNLDDISLDLRVDASTVLTPRLSDTEGRLDIERIGDYKEGDMKGYVEVEFRVAQAKDFSGGRDAKFVVNFDPPELDIARSDRIQNVAIESVPYSALVHASRPSAVSAIKVNGKDVGLNDAIRADGFGLGPEMLRESRSQKLELQYGFGRLMIHAKDAAGRDAPGILVRVKDRFGAPIAEGMTDTGGSAILHLPPSVYNVDLVYQNQTLGSRIVLIQSDVQLSAETPIYKLGFKVIDRLGDILSGAKLSLAIRNVTVAEARVDNDGLVDFGIIGQREYQVKVESLGSIMYDSKIRANIDGATILLDTAFIPLWFNVLVVSILGITVASVIIYAKKKGA